MLVEAAIVLMTLGAPLPPSAVRVAIAPNAAYHTVHFYDNLQNITNRVLDRTIRTDVVRAHTEIGTGEAYVARARLNQSMVEEHCKARLNADGVSNPTLECGAGRTRKGY